MKRKLTLVMAMVACSLPGLAIAHGSPSDSAAKATAKVIEMFEADEEGEVLDQFAGVKAWLDKDVIRVKVYLTGTTELLYACEWDHSRGHELKCKKQ